MNTPKINDIVSYLFFAELFNGMDNNFHTSWFNFIENKNRNLHNIYSKKIFDLNNDGIFIDRDFESVVQTLLHHNLITDQHKISLDGLSFLSNSKQKDPELIEELESFANSKCTIYHSSCASSESFLHPNFSFTNYKKLFSF